MSNLIHISIVGLSLTTTNQIKNLFQAALQHVEIFWTNIADPTLNIVIVNESFIDSPVIQRCKNKNLPILAICTHPTYTNQLIENSLYLPFEDLKVLRLWLKDNVYTPSEQSPSLIQPSSQPQLDIINILRPLWHSSGSTFYVLHINQDQFLIDRRRQSIWVNNDIDPQSIQHLQLEAIGLNQVVHLRYKRQRYDLRYWLWNYLWQNIPLQQLLLSHEHSLQLTHWPQPRLGTPKETLRMAACFEHGAELNDVMNFTEFSKRDVQIFITLGLACDLIEPVSNKSLGFQKNVQVEEKSTGLRGFFSKMRRKLGL